jgi:cytochrome P450
MNPITTRAEYAQFFRGELFDPCPFYHRLRAADPVPWCELTRTWILSRYADVQFALQYDPRLTAERIFPLIDRLPPALRPEMQPLRDHMHAWMQHFEPPDHTRLRGLVSKAFTPRLLADQQAHIQDLVDGFLAQALASGRLELIGDLAFPLPATVIAEMLGLPPADREQFRDWTFTIAAFAEAIRPDFPAVARRAQDSVLELNDYLRRIFAQRRQAPGGDLISALLAAEEQGQRLSEVELFAMCTFVLVAGHHTTTGLLGNGLLALLQNPGQLQRLRQNPALLPSAIEEMLRYDSPIQFLSRYAVQDFELGGKTIRKGDKLWAMVGAANRDPGIFPDPDQFDIGRKPNRHVAFGYGIHFCIGAPLARLEAQVAFATLLRRLPAMRLAAAPPQRRVGINRPLETLPIELN